MTRFFYELSIICELIVMQIGQIFPYWLMGTLLGSFLSVFAVRPMMRMAAGMKGGGYRFPQALAAAALGVASPVCMYGTIPIIAALNQSGVRPHILVTFMISSIMLNPNLLIVSFSLGVPMALLRLFISLTAGLLAGFLSHAFFKGKTIFDFSGFHPDTHIRQKNIFRDIGKSMRITAPYMLAGIVLTALFDRYFPPQLTNFLFRANKGLGVLLMAYAGVPVYLCGGGTVPLLRAWLDAGMSPGSAAAFMLSGPATKLTNLSAVKIVLGARSFALYIAYCLLFAVLMGYLTDFIYRIIHIPF